MPFRCTEVRSYCSNSEARHNDGQEYAASHASKKEARHPGSRSVRHFFGDRPRTRN